MLRIICRSLLQAVWLKMHRVGRDDLFLCLPYGIGDTYVLCSLLGYYFEKNLKTKRVFLAAKPGHDEVLQMFFRNSSVTFRKLDRITKWLAEGYGLAPGCISFGHPRDSLQEQFVNLIGYKGMTMLDSYRIFLNLPESVVPRQPYISESFRLRAKRKFEEYKLMEGQTVLLIPDATSIQSYSEEFWSLLSEKLRRAGYQICLNSPGSSHSGIINCQYVDVSLGELLPFVELCGWFISIRNGLCDLLSSSRAKKTVLYPSFSWYWTTLRDGCSLQTMFGAINCDEILAARQETTYQILDRIEV